MPWKKNHTLPNSVYRWRGRHWSAIQKAESEKGHSLKIVIDIRKEIRKWKELKDRGRAGPRATASRANALIIAMAELADNMQRARQEEGRSLDPWNKVYIGVLKHFWRELPHELRQEIINQTKNS